MAANTDRGMLSFDVSSLFANVSLTFTIELILDRLYSACAINCQDKPRTRRCEESRILLNAPTSDFQFMTELETTLMDRPEQKGVRQWHRYVDNTFVLVELDTNVLGVLNILNGFHPSIKCTFEVEESGSPPFLDVRVSRFTSSDPVCLFNLLLTRHRVEEGVVLHLLDWICMSLRWHTHQHRLNQTSKQKQQGAELNHGCTCRSSIRRQLDRTNEEEDPSFNWINFPRSWRSVHSQTSMSLADVPPDETPRTWSSTIKHSVRNNMQGLWRHLRRHDGTANSSQAAWTWCIEEHIRSNWQKSKNLPYVDLLESAIRP